MNRTPLGTVTKVQYKPGKFWWRPREATAEEQAEPGEVEGKGTTVEFSQIAGMVARRILFWRKPGDKVTMGGAWG
jgi:phosphatidylserine decarboxylase